MKITVTKPKPTSFSQLKVGDLFEHQNLIFVKSDEGEAVVIVHNEGARPNAVPVGKTSSFYPSTHVNPIEEAHFVIRP